MLLIKQLMDAIDFHLDVNGVHQNIFYVQQKKEIHTGLKQLEVE